MIERRFRHVNRVLRWRVLAAAGMMIAAAIPIAGCAKSNLGTVKGTITVDGSPAKSGSIAFFPVDRKSSTAGSEIVDGKYTAKVAPGVAKVEIRVPKVMGDG